MMTGPTRRPCIPAMREAGTRKTQSRSFAANSLLSIVYLEQLIGVLPPTLSGKNYAVNPLISMDLRAVLDLIADLDD